jgi:hypothetical protein
MRDTIWQTIAATPWWMFTLYIYLIWASFLATKPRLVSLKNLFVSSLFFLSLSVMGMCSMMRFISITHYAIWVGTLFLGTGLGYLQFSIMNVRAVKDTHTFPLPGTYLPLIVLLVFFTTKFYWGYDITIDPQSFIDPKNSILLVFIYGLLNGIAIGKLSYALRYLKTPILKENPKSA